MAFRLGNHVIDEILYAVAQNFNDELVFTLDQLKSASIAVSTESTDIVDKKGRLLRRNYKSKSAEFNSTNAFLHPAAMAAGAGSAVENASAANKITMPKIVSVNAGSTVDVSDAKEGTIHVMGIFGNGANDVELTQDTTAVVGVSYALANNNLTVPAGGADAPTVYVIRYERDMEGGMKIANLADKFPDTLRVTFLCAYVDPCDDQLKPCYVYCPSFMPNPDLTINLDSENQELDFNGVVQTDFCGGTEKILYVIYYPDENMTTVGSTTTEPSGDPDPSNP